MLFISADNIIDEIDQELLEGRDIISIFDDVQDYANLLEDTEYTKVTNHLKLEILDIEKFIKVNNTQVISNPILYDKKVPTPDGLLSNEIFGVDRRDRSGIFGYMDLGVYCLDPSCYKAFKSVFTKLDACIAKQEKFSIDNKGNIIQDPNGKTGLDFLRKNINKINFGTDNGSIKKSFKVKYLELNRNKMFINKYLVIPPFYRDSNNSSTNGKGISVSEINSLYQRVINTANSMKSVQEFGFDISGDQHLVLQKTLVEIYDWFCGTSNKEIENGKNSTGISGKFGVLRRANMSKTSDYAARLVITASQLKANSPKDMIADFDHTAVPLSAAMACFKPFVQYYVRQFFENEFIGTEQYQVMLPDGSTVFRKVQDPLIAFSDDEIKKQMEQFINGYNNRLVPIVVPLEGGKNAYMVFKGSMTDPGKNEYQGESILNRRLTWLDIFYQATVQATQNKMVAISRFPIDSRTNQIFTEIRITSTIETEPMWVDGVYYRWYPKFKDSEIGSETSDKFVDTLQMSNLYLKGLGGDFDGDTIVVRGIFTDEANDELRKFKNSKKNFIGFGGSNLRTASGDTVQSLYCLTKILNVDQSKLSLPTF